MRLRSVIQRKRGGRRNKNYVREDCWKGIVIIHIKSARGQAKNTWRRDRGEKRIAREGERERKRQSNR